MTPVERARDRKQQRWSNPTTTRTELPFCVKVSRRYVLIGERADERTAGNGARDSRFMCERNPLRPARLAESHGVAQRSTGAGLIIPRSKVRSLPGPPPATCTDSRVDAALARAHDSALTKSSQAVDKARNGGSGVGLLHARRCACPGINAWPIVSGFHGWHAAYGTRSLVV
jgi:hypothetical protein